MDVLYGSHLSQIRLQRRSTLTVQAHAIHHEVVDAAYLLSERTFLLRFCCKLVDELLNALLVLLLKVYERSVHRMFCIERMTLHPSSSCIAVKIVAGLYREVHVGLVDARSECLLRESRCGGKRERQQ